MNNIDKQGVSSSFKKTMSSLYNLTMMQLKEKMNFSFKQNLKKSLFSLSFFIIGFAAITVLCYFLIFFAKKMSVFDLNGAFPTNVLVCVFTVMFGLSILFTTVSLVQSLYFSRDNFVLLTLPTTPSVVFLSKLLVHYVFEMKKNFLFLIPLFIAYGINSNLPFYYYPWVLFLFLLVVTLPVLIGALLSIPAMYFYQAIRKIKGLQYALLGLVVAGLIALAAYVITLIPADINLVETWGTTFFRIKHFLMQFEKAALPISWLVRLMVGRGATAAIFGIYTVYIFLGLIGVIAFFGVLCFYLSRPLFYSMASKPFEYKKNMNAKVKKERKLTPFLAVVKKEWLMAFRDSSFISVVAQLLIVMPLAIALLNSLYNAMNTRFLGTQLTVCFNIFIVLLFMLSANIRMASAYSKDGSSAYLNKLQPSSCAKLLFAKLTVNFVVGAIGLAATTTVYSMYHALDVKNLVLFAFVIYFVFIAHLFASAQLDIMNSQADQYATFSGQSNNPNENKSIILTFILSAFFAAFWMVMAMEDNRTAWYKVLFLAVAYLGLKIYFYFMKIKVYYREQ